MTPTDTLPTDVCPHCGAKTWEEDTGFRCGSDYIAPEGEDYTLYRTSTCYANENSQLKADVDRLYKLTEDCLNVIRVYCPTYYQDAMECFNIATNRMKQPLKDSKTDLLHIDSMNSPHSKR